MTVRADFSTAEWICLTEAPPLAGLLVLSADKGGTVKETRALAKLYSAARRHKTDHMGSSALMEAIVAETPHLGSNRFDSPDDLDPAALLAHTTDRLQRAVALLVRKATADEVDEYRRFVLGAAQVVAEAHKEGSFLGIGGGSAVSANEQIAIDAVAAALGTRRET